MVKPWEQISSEPLSDLGLFGTRRTRARSPRTGATHSFLLIEMSDWVQVVPFTKSGELILVRQYRQGSRRDSLELPGGLLDKEDETPESAAKRELLEETGYGDGKFESLGDFSPQSALFTNRVHLFLATDLEKSSTLNQDDGEDIEVVRVKPSDLSLLIQNGLIENAVTMAALMRASCRNKASGLLIR